MRVCVVSGRRLRRIGLGRAIGSGGVAGGLDAAGEVEEQMGCVSRCRMMLRCGEKLGGKWRVLGL